MNDDGHDARAQGGTAPGPEREQERESEAGPAAPQSGRWQADPGTRFACAFRDEGSEEAFAELVELYRERLFRVAYRLTGRTEDALDVVQETFVKVYGGIGGWNERSAFYSWLYRVATNLAIDKLRRRKKDRDLAASVLKSERPFAPDNIADVIEASEQEHRLRRLRRAVEALPEAQRAIVVLRHFEGLSLKEIADARGCALGTVKSTLHQAFKSLVAALHPDGAAVEA